MGQKLQNIDRRVIYLLLAVVIGGVLFRPIGLPIQIGEDTRLVHKAIDSLARGQILVLSFDYGASNVPELHPSAIAILKHALKKDVRVVCTALSLEGGMLAQDALSIALVRNPGKKYGEDYINLGYKPGGQVFLEKFAQNVAEACAGVDAAGKPLSGFPIMSQLKNAKDVSLATSLTSGDPGYNQWISSFGSPNGVPITAATIAIGVPAAIALVRSGHLKGVLQGMRGAAEYELLTGEPGGAVSLMDAQSLGHLAIVLFVALGNIGYFMAKKQKVGGRAE